MVSRSSAQPTCNYGYTDVSTDMSVWTLVCKYTAQAEWWPSTGVPAGRSGLQLTICTANEGTPYMQQHRTGASLMLAAGTSSLRLFYQRKLLLVSGSQWLLRKQIVFLSSIGVRQSLGQCKVLDAPYTQLSHAEAHLNREPLDISLPITSTLLLSCHHRHQAFGSTS